MALAIKHAPEQWLQVRCKEECLESDVCRQIATFHGVSWRLPTDYLQSSHDGCTDFEHILRSHPQGQRDYSCEAAQSSDFRKNHQLNWQTGNATLRSGFFPIFLAPLAYFTCCLKAAALVEPYLIIYLIGKLLI